MADDNAGVGHGKGKEGILNLFTRVAPLIILVMGVALAVGATACGGGGGEGRDTPSVEVTPQPTATAEGETPEAAVTPEPTAPAESTVEPSTEAVDAAFAAALEQFDAVSDADCETNNPQNKTCAGLSSQPSEVPRGIAVFGVGAPAGPGFVGVLGRDAAGEWKVWREVQQDYQLLTLPGDALVCGYGAGLTVVSAPAADAAAVGVLEDLTRVRAEEFVLTEQASDLQHGYGWFRLSSPLDGWAYSKYLTNASWEDCSTHDAMEPGP
jgi:hypothetical protein